MNNIELKEQIFLSVLPQCIDVNRASSSLAVNIAINVTERAIEYLNRIKEEEEQENPSYVLITEKNQVTEIVPTTVWGSDIQTIYEKDERHILAAIGCLITEDPEQPISKTTIRTRIQKELLQRGTRYVRNHWFQSLDNDVKEKAIFTYNYLFENR